MPLAKTHVNEQGKILLSYFIRRPSKFHSAGKYIADAHGNTQDGEDEAEVRTGSPPEPTRPGPGCPEDKGTDP